MAKKYPKGDSFPLEALPKPYEQTILHYESFEQFERNASALTILTHTASLLHGDIKGSYKGRKQPAILWGAMIQESGTAKSYILNTFTEFLRNEDLKLSDVNAEYRHKVNTATIEGLVKNHIGNSRGTFLYLDELTAWIEGFTSYGATGVMNRYLELFYGFQETHIRKGSPPVDVPFTKVNIMSCIQPKKLNNAFTEADFDIGWVQRFCFSERYSTEPRFETDTRVQKRFSESLQALNQNIWNLKPKTYEFNKEAEGVFRTWYNDKLAEYNDYEKYRTYLAKLNTYSTRIALVLHCMSAPIGTNPESYISQETLERTILILEYFFRQYEKVIEKVTNQDFNDVNLEYLKSKKPQFQKLYAKLTPKRYSNKELVEHFKGVYKPRQMQNIITGKNLFQQDGNGYTKKVINE
jgi:hypothetical protein